MAMLGAYGGHVGARPLGLPVGLQLYPLNAELEADFDGTLRKIAEIGYRVVELPSFYGRAPKDLKRSLKSAGLDCISVGVLPTPLIPGLMDLETRAEEIFGASRELGLEYVVCLIPPLLEGRWTADRFREPDPFGSVLSSYTAADWREAGKFLNKVGGQAKKAGLRLAFHNHGWEFQKVGESTGFDLLMESTDPAVVEFEMDCAFVAARGFNPAQYLTKYADRISLLHIKDVASLSNTSVQTVAVGDGIIDWSQVFRSARVAGIRQYFVELEPPFIQPVFETLRKSYRYVDGLDI